MELKTRVLRVAGETPRVAGTAFAGRVREPAVLCVQVALAEGRERVALGAGADRVTLSMGVLTAVCSRLAFGVW